MTAAKLAAEERNLSVGGPVREQDSPLAYTIGMWDGAPACFSCDQNGQESLARSYPTLVEADDQSS